MAPLMEAIKMTFLEKQDQTEVYSGTLDTDWLVGSVAFGGGLLASVIDAANQFQAEGRHPDPMHLSSHFLRAVVPGAFSIRVRSIRKGGFVDLLEAQLHQKDVLMLTCQLLYGDLSIPVAGPTMPEVCKPICPIPTHPSELDTSRGIPPDGAQKFYKHCQRADDLTILKENNRIPQEGRGVDGLKHGCWIQLGVDAVGPSVVPVIADIGEVTHRLFPAEFADQKIWWYPSLTINIEFKRKLPLGGAFAAHTFGLFGWKRHLEGGRWNDFFEIWTAPGDIGGSREEGGDGWREEMICVATGSQMALMVPPETNIRYAKRNPESKL